MTRTWGEWYWPVATVAILVIILGPETVALVTNVKNTYSWWVWDKLAVNSSAHPTQWTAVHLLVFGVWMVTMIWLTGHFFWGLWR